MPILAICGPADPSFIWTTLPRRKELPSEVALLLGEPGAIGYGDLQAEIGRLIHGEPWEAGEVPKTLAKTGAWSTKRCSAKVASFAWMVDIADDHYASIPRARQL